MKYLLCLLALSLPCTSFAFVAFTPEAQQQAPVDGAQRAEVRHHPLIEVKYVLRKAPAEQDENPRIEFGESRPVVRFMLLPGAHTVSLSPGYVNPNMYICSSWACRDTL